jgi:hypothetical protein
LAVDDSPVIDEVLYDKSILEDSISLSIPLTNAFTDIDNNDLEIICKVSKNTNTSI